MMRARAELAFDDLLRQLDWLLPRDENGAPAEREYADVVSDLLGFLAREMTDLHAARMEEEKQFLAWLAAQLGCPIDDLAGKTTVLDYPEQTEAIEKLLAVIERNHPAKTSLDVSAPGEYGATNEARDRVIRAFEESMRRLDPIRRKISLTDRLIDLIVYRLYGLSDEEIELIEVS